MIVEITEDFGVFFFQYKLGMSLMRLAFNMKSWDATGGGSELSGPDAVSEGNKYIDRSLKIFLEVIKILLY